MNKKTFLRLYKDRVYRVSRAYKMSKSNAELIDNTIKFITKTKDMDEMISGFLFLSEIKHTIKPQDFLNYMVHNKDKSKWREKFMQENFKFFYNSAFSRVYQDFKEHNKLIMWNEHYK